MIQQQQVDKKVKEFNINQRNFDIFKNIANYDKQEKEKKKKTPLFLINKKFYIIGKIGEGSFGLIYKATHYETKNIVAIKIEELEENKSKNCMLKKEAKFLEKLNHEEGFPQILDSGVQNGNFYMAMTLLSSNLENLKKRCGGKFSLTTVSNIGKILIRRLKVLHSKGIIHRDLKPENILIGSNKEFKKVYYKKKYFFMLLDNFFNIF